MKKWKPSLFAYMTGLFSWPLNPIYIHLTRPCIEGGLLLAATINLLADQKKQNLIYLKDKRILEYTGMTKADLLIGIKWLSSYKFLEVDRIRSARKTRVKIDYKKLILELKRASKDMP